MELILKKADPSAKYFVDGATYDEAKLTLVQTRCSVADRRTLSHAESASWAGVMKSLGIRPSCFIEQAGLYMEAKPEGHTFARMKLRKFVLVVACCRCVGYRCGAQTVRQARVSVASVLASVC